MQNISQRPRPDLDELERIIKRFIDDELLGKEDEPVGVEDNLFVSGNVDSVGIMRLITHLEAELALKIPPRDLVPKNFRTVRAMARYLDGLAE